MEVECQACGWIGEEGEKEAPMHMPPVCPICGGDDFIETEDSDER